MVYHRSVVWSLNITGQGFILMGIILDAQFLNNDAFFWPGTCYRAYIVSLYNYSYSIIYHTATLLFLQDCYTVGYFTALFGITFKNLSLVLYACFSTVNALLKRRKTTQACTTNGRKESIQTRNNQSELNTKWNHYCCIRLVVFGDRFRSSSCPHCWKIVEILARRGAA